MGFAKHFYLQIFKRSVSYFSFISLRQRNNDRMQFMRNHKVAKYFGLMNASLNSQPKERTPIIMR